MCALINFPVSPFTILSHSMILPSPSKKYTSKAHKYHSKYSKTIRMYIKRKSSHHFDFPHQIYSFNRCPKLSLRLISKNIDHDEDYVAPELLERISSQVGELNDSLNELVNRRQGIMHTLLALRLLLTTSLYTKVLPSHEKIVPVVSPSPITIESTPIRENNNETDSLFVISSDKSQEPFHITKEFATLLLVQYSTNCNPYLPIFPTDFFRDLTIVQLLETNTMLFWVIMLTGLLYSSSLQATGDYNRLVSHVQHLVTDMCLSNTPRSVYILLALLILTTWPIPEIHLRTNENFTLKLVSLANTMCMQLGLHRLEFISEFSRKTLVNVSAIEVINNIIRARIFKLIHINSDYWHINLGLLNMSSGTSNHILESATRVGSLSPMIIASEDLYINSLLKVSILQAKANYLAQHLISRLLENRSILLLPDQTNVLRSINQHMYHVILSEIESFMSSTTAGRNLSIWDTVLISLEYAKLQLNIYTLGSNSCLNMSIVEYRTVLKKTIANCFKITQICDGWSGIHKMPIYYRFPFEMAALFLCRVFKLPLLDDIDEYVLVKLAFTRLYNVIQKSNNDGWINQSLRIKTILQRFNLVDNIFLAANTNSFALICKMLNHLANSLHYEILWHIYDYDRNKTPTCIDWSMYGHHPKDDVAAFIESNQTIFS